MNDNKNRTPHTKLSLWIEASRMTDTGKALPLDDEEREMLPHELRNPTMKNPTEHPINTPWEIEINDETSYLADELNIDVWINGYDDEFDGENIVVHHESPTHTNSDDDYPTQKLKKGGEISVTKILDQGTALYNVILNIAWPQQKENTIPLQEALQNMREKAEEWNKLPNVADNFGFEIHTFLAHGPKKARKYKIYNPDSFPEKFIEELNSDSEALNDLTQIVIQAYKVYQEYHEHSDDYIDAARAYGEDCSPWYTTERVCHGPKTEYDIKD
ncbi:MAG: hypothetical protein J6X58_07005 [Bacteroidales bacterium]|nr:hypothetical protein [Bacteroidales bacterium]